VKNQWSRTAAAIGFLVALFLGIATDVPDTYLIRVIAAGPALIAQFIRLFGLTFAPSFRNIALLVVLGAIGNAVWCMIVAEAVRMLFQTILADCRFSKDARNRDNGL
jgi:hypothetical protein